jgi:hypothetical protein
LRYESLLACFRLLFCDPAIAFTHVPRFLAAVPLRWEED